MWILYVVINTSHMHIHIFMLIYPVPLSSLTFQGTRLETIPMWQAQNRSIYSSAIAQANMLPPENNANSISAAATIMVSMN